MKIIKNADMSSDDYHKDTTHTSSSVLKLFLVDPRAYHDAFVLGNRPEQKKTAALVQGCHVHTAILEPEKMDLEYAIYPGAIKRGKEWDKFLLENGEKSILTSAQNQLTQKLVDSFNRSEVVLGEAGNEKSHKLSDFYKDGEPEESVFGELDGMLIKVRFDYRKQFDTFGSVNDLKTTMEPIGNISQMREICERMHYDLSAALYIDMASKAFGVPYDFYFTFLSKADGKVKMYKASKAFLARGREKYKTAIREILAARKTGKWFSATIEEL